MSARREKRLRRLERRVEYLEKLSRVNEIRLSDIERMAASPMIAVRHTDQESKMARPRRGFLQRIKEIFTFT